MALYAALDITGLDAGLALAVADDYSPTAAEEHEGRLTVFFATAIDRDRAGEALAAQFPAAHTTTRDVDDEDWARRSQQNLKPVTVGCITIAPPWSLTPVINSQPVIPNLQAANLVLIIEPSMGFGTGHHATTRLCLAALQMVDLTEAFVLDVGTGSGVLAMAARRLGARAAVGIDTDADAIQSANENLQLNPDLNGVAFERGDLYVALSSPAFLSSLMVLPSSQPGSARTTVDVVTANLTGALLIRSAELLVNAVRIGGHLVLSGLMQSEQSAVLEAFADRTVPISVASEEEWAGLLLRRTL